MPKNVHIMFVNGNRLVVLSGLAV